tara:strand:+ start:13853 stop:13981 length:129 start_codon:yes stop_codon:yes gene_type:complete
MIKRIRDYWNAPRTTYEAEWYILLATFMVLWMWMIIAGVFEV